MTQAAGENAPDDTTAAIRTQHAALSERLAELTGILTEAAADSDDVSGEAVALFAWCRSDLLEHLKAAEANLFAPARAAERTALVVRAIEGGHHRLRDAVDRLDGVDGAIEAAALGAQVTALFAEHVWHTEQILLPALNGAELEPAVAGVTELVGGKPTSKAARAQQPASQQPTSQQPASQQPAAQQTASQPAATPTGAQEPATDRITATEDVDVRPLPHQGRHNVIFGKLQQLADAGAIVIVNDHDPKPLRYQTEALWPGKYEWTYLEEGPEVWRVKVSLADD